MSLDYRVTLYNTNDFILNYEDVARSLNKACHRDGAAYRVVGIFQNQTEVIFMLATANEPCERQYVISPFPGQDTREIAGEIQARWQGGFLSLGQIKLPDKLLGVFEKTVFEDSP